MTKRERGHGDGKGERARGGKKRGEGLRRQHENIDGKPKKALTSRNAAVTRARGGKVYLCDICGQHHAGTPLPGPKKRVAK